MKFDYIFKCILSSSEFVAAIIGGLLAGIFALAAVLLSSYLNNRKSRKEKSEQIENIKRILFEELKWNFELIAKKRLKFSKGSDSIVQKTQLQIGESVAFEIDGFKQSTFDKYLDRIAFLSPEIVRNLMDCYDAISKLVKSCQNYLKLRKEGQKESLMGACLAIYDEAMQTETNLKKAMISIGDENAIKSILDNIRHNSQG